MDHTRHAAEFVSGLEYQQIPELAIEAARAAILDSLGVALAGSQEAPGKICAGLARDEAAKGESVLFGQGFRSSSTMAALANGAATHAMDYDASFAIMGQPMAGLTATVFALAEPLRASGQQLFEAYVAGYELTAKLAWSMPEEWREGGWHSTATIGSLGCAAAAAKLLRLDVDQTCRALGIVSSMAGGSVGNFGTMTKPLHAGLAARNGVLAARLASRDFTGSEQMLDGANGFHGTLARGMNPDLDRLNELGSTYEVEGGVRFKFYPCGGLAHTAIDAALALRAEQTVDPDAVERIDVRATAYTASRIVYGIPETELQAKFSMPYLVARALVDGRVTPDSFSDEAIREPPVVALARKVHLEGDASLESDASGRRPCVLTVHMNNGKSLERRVDYPKGSVEARLTRAEVEEKFQACARRALSEPAVKRALDMVNHLESLDDVGPLSTLLLAAERL